MAETYFYKTKMFVKNKFMDIALEEARIAFNNNETPVGCVITDKNGEIVTKAHNKVEKMHNPLKHAEIIAIESALEKTKKKYLDDCDLYVTLEPCPMCAMAISHVRIKNLYFAAEDEKSGGTINGPRVFSSSSCHHKTKIYSGIMAEESENLLKTFFRQKR